MAGPYVKDIYLPSGIATLTWAELFALNAASYNPGQIFHVTDVGVGGSYWYSNGVRWRAVNGALWLVNLASDVAHDGTTSQLKLAEVTIPAGLIQQGDMLEQHISIDATAGGSTASVYTRLGTAGTTADNAVGGTNGTSPILSQPAGSNVWAGLNKRLKRTSATTLRPLDVIGAGGLGGTGTAVLVSNTVPDLDANATKLGLYYVEGTGGVRIATLRQWSVELITAGA